jgi:hypothetical protein
MYSWSWTKIFFIHKMYCTFKNHYLSLETIFTLHAFQFALLALSPTEYLLDLLFPFDIPVKHKISFTIEQNILHLK